ncbi:MAG: formylmethanofuran dehydrogenase subunit E family protein [Candidatus Thermoplasmatota archaeon]|nr:formylmethanofuran dehydrogenase subunit E family protein [Candidatus Thermoplasmatota archaeon]MBU4255755.1 formylmethanofuran dehydrogenase subunit E family protein [Candidatus Thermoplasmatota archaeon]MCG2825097.1 formylmethanofuran dehydrogenase subunit E family protein [Thermoplasmatales archaeon]
MSELENLKKFHGHLGPYAVIGLRMGKLAVEKMGVRGKKLKCVVRTGIKPPISCIIDGIQFSSSCTLGKGNIKVEDEGVAEAVFFKNNKKIKIRLKDEIKNRVDKEMSKENEERLSLWIYEMGEEELFDVSLS